MKATGEVIAIDSTFEGSLLKAVRSLDSGLDGLAIDGMEHWPDAQLVSRLRKADDQRLFCIAEVLR